MRIFPGWPVLVLLAAFAAPAMAESTDQHRETPDEINLEEIHWIPWSPEVFAQARAGQRLVLLDLTAEWCQFCKKMDATTYRDPQVIERIGRDYIAVRVDDQDRSELGRRYAGTGRPGTVVLDAEGNELIVKVGYLPPQWMVWLLEAVATEQAVALRDANE